MVLMRRNDRLTTPTQEIQQESTNPQIGFAKSTNTQIRFVENVTYSPPQSVVVSMSRFCGGEYVTFLWW